MFATVTLGDGDRSALLVPSEAVIRTGTRSIVMLSEAGGRFHPAEVRPGSEANGRTEILAAVREQDPETPVILMTAQASLQSAIQAVNQGAFYYIQKPFSNDDLVAICRRAAEQRLLKAENKQLKQEIRRRERSGLVKPLGKSRPFVEVLKLAA